MIVPKSVGEEMRKEHLKSIREPKQVFMTPEEHRLFVAGVIMSIFGAFAVAGALFVISNIPL